MKTLILLLCVFSLSAHAKLVVGGTTTDMESLVKIVGGDHVTAFSIAKGTQDPHKIEAKPSYMVKLRRADLIVAHGLALESAWLFPLIEGARNPRINKGTLGLLRLGSQLHPIEVPKGTVSRAEGDVHPGGNPHFQLDPIRMGQAAILVAQRLSEIDHDHQADYMKNAKAFQSEMEQKTKEWQKRIKASGVKEIVTYHKTFSYFCDRFGLICQLQLEPKPGIPPTAGHLMDVFAQMKNRKIKMVLIENYYDDAIAGKIKQQVPGSVVKVVPVSVNGTAQATDPAKVVETLVEAIEAAHS